MSEIHSRGYARPDMLVSTDWVANRLSDTESVRIIESNEDQLLYSAGHIPNAVEIDWIRDLNDPIRRDYLSREAFQKLMARIGVTPETTLVFYGDSFNWWACYALWVFQLFGHTNAKIMDGGRIKWAREGREMSRDVPQFPRHEYAAPERDDSRWRAFYQGVFEHQTLGKGMVDVRTPEEYRGERLHMPDCPNEGAIRGGHIPGAANIPWELAIHTEDATFKDAQALRALYEAEHGLRPDEDVIVYCRIGERSSHTWFVLHYLLGYESVKNYDGSWVEWGNLVGVPIERG